MSRGLAGSLALFALASACQGSGPADVFVVGDTGTILHWNGTAWALTQIATPESLLGVWGSSASSVWVVGTTGTILHGP